jgi:D-lactate dehydrogenase
MRIAVFSSKIYDRETLSAANAEHGHELVFLEPHLDAATVALARGFPAVCVFVNDRLTAATLHDLAGHGTRLIALRCAGFNNVDVEAADQLGVVVARVPAYSPYAVAEHAVCLMLALNRNIHRAYARVREGNFSLQGLLGFDMHGRTAGIVGTGRVGAAVTRILTGFGCRVLAHDPFPNQECRALGAQYVFLEQLWEESDIVSLHCPLTPQTHRLVDTAALRRMKRGVMLINTGRGALIDTSAVIEAIKTGQIGHLGLDVYEEEADLFFEDLSDRVIQDDLFMRLLTFPNVIITGHQAFFTAEALHNIAATTLANVSAFENGEEPHRVTSAMLA